MTDGYIFNAALLCKDEGYTLKRDILTRKSEELGLYEPFHAAWTEEMFDIFACLVFGVADETDIDSGTWPQYADVGAESDHPEHCDKCKKFLENKLTTEGAYWVRATILDKEGDQDVLKEWEEFYSFIFEKGE